MRIFVAFMFLFFSTAHAAEEWTKIADENGTVPLSKQGVVRYGGYGSFVERTMTAGVLHCNNSTFGDPNIGVEKECSVRDISIVAKVAPFKPACPPYTINSTRTTLRFFVNDLPANLLGYLTADADRAGAVLTWWCKGKYTNTPYAYFGYRSAVPENPEQVASEFQSSTDAAKIAALTSRATCKEGMPISDPACRKLDALETLAAKQNADTTPPFPQWTVARNGSYPTRPVYPIVNGVRSATAHKTIRATVGAACTCHALVVEEGANSYCLVAYGDMNLALCTLVR